VKTIPKMLISGLVGLVVFGLMLFLPGVDVRLLASMGLSSGGLCPVHMDPQHLLDA
jgi:hypothetical protein